MHEFLRPKGLPSPPMRIGTVSIASQSFKSTPSVDAPPPLPQRVLQRIRTDASVIRWTPEPDAFEWFDGLVGGMRRFTPRILVARCDGTLTFVATMDRADLLFDPELAGRRRHIEAECLSLRATLEIWTEEEADALSRAPLILPAFGAVRSGYLSETQLTGRPPRIVEAVVEKLRLLAPVEVSGTWVARCHLTGIPMVILPGYRLDVDTGAAFWNQPLPEDPQPGSCDGMTAAPTRNDVAQASLNGSAVFGCAT